MNRSKPVFGVLALAFAMLLSWSLAARAEGDPPSRVARLGYSSGSVSFQPGGEGEWVTAVRNRPLTTGDNLWADKDSRAELHVGSTALRMNSETSLTFLDLDDHTVQLRVSLGSLIVRVRHLDDDDLMEVDTPNLAFRIERPGEYRIDVNPDGNQTLCTVWRGRGEATGGGASYVVVAGQQARFNGTDTLEHDIEQLPPRDDFDNWAFEQDAREDRAETRNYISEEMTGYEDLDDYGRWDYAAGYGPVWVPAGVAVGWAPYRFGHWAWIEPWGWTWVEDEPWGFAPFHYGRWAFVESRWCWVPGPVVIRPVYAPALVAFVGGGAGFSFSLAIGGGPVGWFPLAPGEVYVPPYRVSPVYVNQVNITNTRVNVTQVTNVYNTYVTNKTTNITYVNRNVNNAVTVVSHDTFVNARPVRENLVRVDEKELARAPVLHTVPVQPSKSSVLGAGTPTRVHPPQPVLDRRVVATRNPSPPREPFNQRQATYVKTEPQQSPQPAVRNEPGRAPEPANVGRPAEVPHTQESHNVPRPTQNTVEESRGGGTRTDRGWEPPHPLVKPAPPVQPKPERQQSEESKFHSWQQQRPEPPRPSPQAKPEPPRPPQPHPNEKH